MIPIDKEIQEIIKRGAVEYAGLDVPCFRQAIDRDIYKAGYALCEREYGDKYAESYQKSHREIVMEERKAGMQLVADWIGNNDRWIHLNTSFQWQSFLKGNDLEMPE